MTDDETHWTLVYEGLDPAREGLREALCTLGNGYFATRGAAPWAAADDVHYPGTYLAGGYDRLPTEVAGRVVENEDLVNLPNWLPLTFRPAEGEWFDPRRLEVRSFRQELDLRRGVLRREVRVRDAAGRHTTVRELRLVHMGDHHTAALTLELTPEDWSGPVELRTALDGRVQNAGVPRYRALRGDHLEPLEAEAKGGETLCLKVRTKQSDLRVALAARTRLWLDGQPVAAERRTRREGARIGQEAVVAVEAGQALRAEKVLALFTSRDAAIAECGLAARTWVARQPDVAELVERHTTAWRHLWERFDIGFEAASPEDGDDGGALLVLRLHTFHLLQTASPHTMDLDVGVPARGWHGEAYRGHIFWDELFIFPLLDLRVPEITRSLLRYRHRRLPEARAAAREAGFRGALYPWQSGSDGREETQVLHLNPRSGRWLPDHTHRQRHVNAAIAWNVWQYVQTTGDLEFLAFAGAEIILEIARLWASIATLDRESGRYDIAGVIGPDEYHDALPGAAEPGLRNNTYTNVMAAWCLCRGLEVLDLLPAGRRRELTAALQLTDEELHRWDEVSRRLRLVFHSDGVPSQFEGYERLEELDWERYRARHGDALRLDRILEAEGDSANRYKASKQADVLMLFYLFPAEDLIALLRHMGYEFTGEQIPRTIDYYLRRTSNGSTLAQVVAARVLARSDRPASWRHFRQALRSDVADVQGGTTAEGIHLGAMAGAVDIVQRAWTGLDVAGGRLRLNPSLPAEVTRLALQLRFRGASLRIDITPDTLRVACLDGGPNPVTVDVRGSVETLRGGAVCVFRYVAEDPVVTGDSE